MARPRPAAKEVNFIILFRAEICWSTKGLAFVFEIYGCEVFGERWEVFI